MSSTVKVLRAKLASCCLSCYLVPPSSTKSPLSPPTLSSEHPNSNSPTTTAHLCSPACYLHNSAPSASSRLYQCPQCQTSLADMSQQWLLMDSERASWVMPQHLKDFKVKVQCRDCHKEGDATYHIVGLKCPSCGSYNTVRSGNEEIPMDATIVNQLLQQRRRRRRRRRRESRQERNGDRGTSSSSSDSDSDEGDNHRNQHRSSGDSDDGEDAGNQFCPRPRQNDRSSHHGGVGDGGDDNNGEDPTHHPPNEAAEDNSQSYDGDASENDDIDSNDTSSSSSDCDSDSDYYETQRSRTYVSFAQRGYSAFFSPIEVPVGSEPGALEWWHDPNDDSELEQRTARDQRPPPPPPRDHERREECDNGVQQDCLHQRHDQSRSEPHLVPDELNSPTEVRRRAIAQSIVQNMRLWNSDSDSFSELSSEEDEEEEGEKSSASWVTEEEEVIVGMRGSELQEQEVVEIVMEDDDSRDLPATITTTTTAFGDIVVHVQSESGVESAESWFTSSDTSYSQPCSQEQGNKHSVTISPPLQNDSGLNSIEVLEDGQRKVERSSVCSSISTDDSLAWETACEDLPPPQLCS